MISISVDGKYREAVFYVKSKVNTRFGSVDFSGMLG